MAKNHCFFWIITFTISVQINWGAVHIFTMKNFPFSIHFPSEILKITLHECRIESALRIFYSLLKAIRDRYLGHFQVVFILTRLLISACMLDWLAFCHNSLHDIFGNKGLSQHNPEMLVCYCKENALIKSLCRRMWVCVFLKIWELLW